MCFLLLNNFLKIFFKNADYDIRIRFVFHSPTKQHTFVALPENSLIKAVLLRETQHDIFMGNEKKS